MREAEGEMQRIGLEKKKLREALGQLEGVGSGFLKEEKDQLKRALKSKEADFAAAVRRHVVARKAGGVVFSPAASSTMAAPSARGAWGGGRGAVRGVTPSQW